MKIMSAAPVPAPNAALCLKPCCIETSEVFAASMHQLCGVDIFLPTWNKIIRFKKKKLLRVALAGRFCPQCDVVKK